MRQIGECTVAWMSAHVDDLSERDSVLMTCPATCSWPRFAQTFMVLRGLRENLEGPNVREV